MVFIKSIELQNFLSFGSQSERIPLESLNIIIGPNGVGKSNFLEAFSLLQSTPHEMVKPIRARGLSDWLWKGGKDKNPIASVEAVFGQDYIETDRTDLRSDLRYKFEFTSTQGVFEIVEERIENAEKAGHYPQPFLFYAFQNGHPVLNVFTSDASGRPKIELKRSDIDPQKTILAQRRDPDRYPEITRLANLLPCIRVYRDISFGPHSPLRQPQNTDGATRWLEEDGNNLSLVLNSFLDNVDVRNTLREHVKSIYDGIDDFGFEIVDGRVRPYLIEGKMKIPSISLSDGTLRYLCLLSILLNPDPPPFICIDEPELGVHPDLIHKLADLLENASQRTQLVITTHSRRLVDAFSDKPESVLVAEKSEAGSFLHRLTREEITPWLDKYSLGSLWESGQIGGNRW